MSNECIHADVGIIGAGPAGCAAAIALRDRGVGRVVLVDKASGARDRACGGAISPAGIRVLKKLGAWEDVERQACGIRGLRMVTPDGQESVFSGRKRVDAIVCRRKVLDQALLARAQALGVTFLSGFDAETRIVDQDGRAGGFVAHDGRCVKADMTIVAGGGQCVLANDVRHDATTQGRTLQGAIARWADVDHRPEHIEMVFDRAISPHFGWLFPEREGTVNIGMLFEPEQTRVDGLRLFEQFLQKNFGERLAMARRCGDPEVRVVSRDYRVGPLTQPGVILAGEAGRLVHPSTAEGIHPALQSGFYAALTAFDIVTRRRGEVAALRAYEWRCKLAFEALFAAEKAFGELVQRTPTLDWLVTAGHHPWVQQLAGRILDRI